MDAKGYETVLVEPDQPILQTESTPSADLPVGSLEPTMYPDSSMPHGLDTPGAETVRPQPGQLVAPTAAVVSPPLEPTMPVQRKARRLSRNSAALLIGLVVVIIAGGVLGSLSLLAHFRVIGAQSGATTVNVVRGGTWTEERLTQIRSFPMVGATGIGWTRPSTCRSSTGMRKAWCILGRHAKSRRVHNGGISADATTWTFHLRPGLVWSDGAPYDARDVDYTWKLWLNPKFGAAFPNGAAGFELIRSADVSADHLSISFHLTHAYAPFLRTGWMAILAPLPAHHFSRMAPEQILKSSDILNPQVTSGPFMLAESLPGDHYTLVRNPRYYRASEGLPYLDKVVFRSVETKCPTQGSAGGDHHVSVALAVDASKVQAYQRLSSYTLVTSPTSAAFEALWFNFHNTVLASHPEVRQAMAMAIDQQALIQVARQGFATPLCTDHPSALHPGYEPFVSCPEFDLALANQLLSDNGWVKGSDGVRTREGQRLEFEFSTCTSCGSGRLAGEAIIERNFKAIGIKLDIHNYPGDTFFGSFLPGGRRRPPTGAMAGRYDIAEFGNSFGYDPDNSSLLSCDQIPPNGGQLYLLLQPCPGWSLHTGTGDSGSRRAAADLHQIHQIYLTQFPLIVLYSPTDLSIVRKGTHNYLPSALSLAADTINIWEWWCDKGKC